MPPAALADEDEAPPPLAALPGQAGAAGSNQARTAGLSVRPPAAVTDGAGRAVAVVPAPSSRPTPTPAAAPHRGRTGLTALPAGALASMAAEGGGRASPAPPRSLMLSPAAAARAKGLLSPSDDMMAAVLADPALVALLTDPAVARGVETVRASADPGAALAAAAGAGPAGRRVGELFARLAGVAAARCEAAARAEAADKEEGRAAAAEEERAAGIVELP